VEAAVFIDGSRNDDARSTPGRGGEEAKAAGLKVYCWTGDDEGYGADGMDEVGMD